MNYHRGHLVLSCVSHTDKQVLQVNFHNKLFITRESLIVLIVWREIVTSDNNGLSGGG